MPDAQLAEIEQALAAATPGPWTVMHPGQCCAWSCVDEPEVHGMGAPDAHLIGNSPAWLAALLAEVKRLREQQATNAALAERRLIEDLAHRSDADWADCEDKGPAGAYFDGFGDGAAYASLPVTEERVKNAAEWRERRAAVLAGLREQQQASDVRDQP